MIIMNDLKYNYDTERQLSENHSKLINAVQQFDKSQRVKKAHRTEPSLDVSEFHLVKSGITNSNAIEIVDLAKALKENGHRTDICKMINATKIKENTISKPIEMLTAERIKRTLGFENSQKKLARWTGIIARNRTAASVTFPLNQSSMKLESTSECTKRFRLQSELEKKLANLEPVINIENDKDNFLLTLQEISQRRKEAARFRAQQSYKEAKAYRQNKIKSKMFHRIQRKEKFRKTLKEFEDLQKTDPYAALEKLEQLNRIRVKERMTLRHKSVGQWAKIKLMKAKHDKDSRQMLVEQLSIGKGLTQKIKINEDSEEDNDNNDPQICFLSIDKDNPWIKSANSQSEIDDFINGYQKYSDKVNKISNDKTVSKDGESKVIDHDNKNNAEFKKLKKENLPQTAVQPAKKVIEKFLSQELCKSNTKNSHRDQIKEKNSFINHSKSIKKLSKNSKYKFGGKFFKNVTKMNESKEKSGTTLWLVSSIGTLEDKILNVVKNNDIDELFELHNDKLQKNLSKKYSKLEPLINQEIKYPKEIESTKVKIKNISVSDIENLSLNGQTKLKLMVNKLNNDIEIVELPNANLQTDHSVSETNLNDYALISITKEIDPKKFMNIKSKCLKTLIPDNISEEAVANDDTDGDQKQIISEAFADDNVVEEFRNVKAEEVKKTHSENVNLSLPGWGRWSGKDIKQSSDKKQRFIMKISKEKSRRDENKGDVVIIEEKCARIKQHLVSELVFPFTRVQDFEASVRTPLGRDFIPEKMFNKLIQPAIKTKMGKIIEPMTENMLVTEKI